MNKKLIDRLAKKWSTPGGQPAKGASFVEVANSCLPCAQSDALMEYRNESVEQVKDFLLNQTEGLDKQVAKALGISLTHSILLRIFNDFSSENPITPLREPEKVLGPNYKKVLAFWKYLDTLPSEFWGNWQTDIGKQKDADAAISKALPNLDVIQPDLHYKEFGVAQEPSPIEDHRRLSGKNANFGLRALRHYDSYCPKGYAPYIVANATLEIQCLGIKDGIPKGQPLYYCGLLGFNPFRPAFNARVVRARVNHMVNRAQEKILLTSLIPIAQLLGGEVSAPSHRVDSWDHQVVSLEKEERWFRYLARILSSIQKAKSYGQREVIVYSPKGDFAGIVKKNLVKKALEMSGVKVEPFGMPYAQGWRLSWAH